MQTLMIIGQSDKELFGCAYPEWQEQRESTTFWSDFTIADAYGIPAIKDTFNRAFEGWKNNYKYLTELVGVLNHKIWEWYEKDEEVSKVYNDLWEKADSYATDNLKDDELKHFLYVLD